MNGLKIRAMSGIARLRRQHNWGAAALAITLMVPGAAFASTRITGSDQSVSVNAEDSSIKEVLSALSKQFKLQFESSANLDKQVTGTYQGSLQRVVARLLEGYNFFMRTNEGVLEITVLGTQNGPTIAGTQPAVSRVTATPVEPQKTSTFTQAQKPQQAQQPQLVQPPKTAAGNPPSPIAGKATPTTTGGQAPSPDSAAPPLVLKVAEGPMPVPGASTAGGPVPKPATSTMPTPTTSGTMPSIAPTPSSAANSAALPMPTSSSPFPGITTPTNPASSTASGASAGSSPANTTSAPTTQKP